MDGWLEIDLSKEPVCIGCPALINYGSVSMDSSGKTDVRDKRYCIVGGCKSTCPHCGKELRKKVIMYVEPKK